MSFNDRSVLRRHSWLFIFRMVFRMGLDIPLVMSYITDIGLALGRTVTGQGGPMTMNKPNPQYPDRTLEESLVKLGYSVRCMWQSRGPKDTAVEWMECLHASNGDHAGMFIVETFKEGGWTVFVEPTHRNDTDATVSAVIETLKRD